MAYGTSAYRLDAFPLYEPEPRQQRERADVRVVRTGGAAQTGTDASLLVTAAKLAAVLIAVVAVLCFIRIGLTSATVATMIESDSISTQIEEARATGVGLEMEQSVLTSPSAIKQAVNRLGMAAPEEVGTIALGPDVVVLDEAGSLSLSGSVKNVVRAQE